MVKTSLYTVIRIRPFVKWEYADLYGRGAYGAYFVTSPFFLRFFGLWWLYLRSVK